MKLRLGIESGRKLVLERVRSLGAPVLVSANSLFKDGKFGTGKAFAGLDVALDSGGFVAMKKYGGYRWSCDDYAQLAQRMSPAWWAQMDFCCEPEIAAARAEVFSRIDRTVEHLHQLEDIARRTGQAAPMPVLQGWMPQDYVSGPIFERAHAWPELVGIGSVCRRHVHGPDGVLAVVAALDAKVPEHVRFHLFGVKSQAIKALVDRFPQRIASTDSMAWNVTCRRECYRAGRAQDGAARAEYMEKWYNQQQELLRS